MKSAQWQIDLLAWLGRRLGCTLDQALARRVALSLRCLRSESRRSLALVKLTRRGFLTLVGSAAFTTCNFGCAGGAARGEHAMYGLIGKIIAVPGERDALAAILLEGTQEMPGCLSYVVALDPADADALWVTEVWDTQASHEASLALPGVREAIARGGPLIAGFGERTVTEPLGGHGLQRSGR